MHVIWYFYLKFPVLSLHLAWMSLNKQTSSCRGYTEISTRCCINSPNFLFFWRIAAVLRLLGWCSEPEWTLKAWSFDINQIRWRQSVEGFSTEEWREPQSTAMFLKELEMAFSTFFKFLHLAYYTICVHLLCIQSLSLSLFPFSSHFHTPGRKWGEVAIEFPFSCAMWNRKKFRATVLASISCRHWTQP